MFCPLDRTCELILEAAQSDSALVRLSRHESSVHALCNRIVWQRARVISVWRRCRRRNHGKPSWISAIVSVPVGNYNVSSHASHRPMFHVGGAVMNSFLIDFYVEVLARINVIVQLQTWRSLFSFLLFFVYWCEVCYAPQVPALYCLLENNHRRESSAHGLSLLLRTEYSNAIPHFSEKEKGSWIF